jgi:hypothetical protein
MRVAYLLPGLIRVASPRITLAGARVLSRLASKHLVGDSTPMNSSLWMRRFTDEEGQAMIGDTPLAVVHIY